MKRCGWLTGDETYIAYHDLEWGVPVHQDDKLFEMLILEGTQAGLSWLTVLRRRENYRAAYDNFDPQVMARWDQEKIASLLLNPGIIRNRLKIEAARTNARAFLKTTRDFDSFDAFIWSFVNNRPVQNSWGNIREIPAKTPESERMSRELKQRGFKFVGATICYAFMQAVGMVNDHTLDCFRHKEIRRKN
jgi:DNA-3-methyladenine glycosylase I